MTTTTITTSISNQVNASLDPGLVIEMIGQGPKYEYKLRSQGQHMQTQHPGW